MYTTTTTTTTIDNNNQTNNISSCIHKLQTCYGIYDPRINIYYNSTSQTSVYYN